MNDTVEWIISEGLTEYEDAVTFMETRVQQIIEGKASEAIWLLEHPRFILLAPVPVNRTSCPSIVFLSIPPSVGAIHVSWAGPTCYLCHARSQSSGKDIRAFVKALEDWVIATLDQFNIKGEIREGRVGVWVERPEKPQRPDGHVSEDKIAAIGIRIRKWVSFHGISINVEPELDHFTGIVPCGISEHGVTSLVDLGLPVTLHDLDIELKKTFKKHFS